MKGAGAQIFENTFERAPCCGEQPLREDVRARQGMAMDLGVPASRQGHRDNQSVKDCGRGYSEHRGVAQRCRAGAAQGDQRERPVEDPGVHHMALPVDMQSGRERYHASCEL